MRNRSLVLVTNDDGVYSPGLMVLYEAVKEICDAVVVAPESPRSATSLSITLHKPLRVNKVRVGSEVFYAVSGNPSDAVHLALLKILKEKPSLVLSGVNLGDNTSIQVILTSGTVGACFQAALLGVKGIAFSTCITDPEALAEKEDYIMYLKRFIKIIVEAVLDVGFPDDVDVLNVNFPSTLSSKTKVKITRPARMRFEEQVTERVDPMGRKYYWIYGEVLEEGREGTDVYAVFKENAISITPLTLNITPYGLRWVNKLTKIIEEVQSKLQEA